MAKRGRNAPGRSDMVRLGPVLVRLGICRTTGYKWIRDGVFPVPVEKIGAHYYARAVDVNAYFGTLDSCVG